jgi:hypothetical protein
MNTSYYFNISNLERESDGFVHSAEYYYAGISTTDGVERSYSVAGICTFTRPDTLVPYTDLTESQVSGWISTGVGTTSIAAMKTEIDKHIDPNIGGTPW